jgi:polysaccharide biosynthesis/export protein
VPPVSPTGSNLTRIRINETPTDSAHPATGAESLRPPLVPDPPTEFQQLVESSVGKRLPFFGYNLFREVPSTFAPADHIAVPANYIIGPGDELLIRAWGQIDVDARVIVDRNGQIYLPKVGSVSVAGIRYEQLSNHLKEAIEVTFRHFDLRVTLGQLRSIQIFVVGNARRPGTYTVSSLSTLVNALFASGGVSIHGSMRHIELKRGDRIVSEFDLYDLLKGDKSKDVVLLPGDVIYIPPVGPQVAMAGSVNFPAIYELHGAATLAEELEVAGGLSNVADGQHVIVERIENRSTRKVDEFTLDVTGESRELHDGDVVRVVAISPKFDNAVTLRGNVAEPGRYPFRPGMKVRDLIPQRELLLTRGFWNNQNAGGNAARGNQQWQVEGLGRPSVAEEQEGLRNDGKGLLGGQRETADTDWRKQSSAAEGPADLRNNVKRNAPDINWDYAVVQRINPNDLSTVLIPFNLRKAILEGSEADNVALQAGDVVTIFSQHDIAVSIEHQSKFVRLEGEIRAPGVYQVNAGETLRMLLARAGGLTGKAFIFGANFTRETAQKQQQAGLDQMVRDLEVESQHQEVYATKAALDQQETLQAQMEAKRSLIQKLHEIKASGRIVLEIGPSEARVEAFPDIEMEDGDSLVVPNKPQIVTVVGAVYNQSSLLFRGGRRIAYYLKLSGSGTRDADMKHLFVIRADGSVISKTNNSSVWSGSLETMRVIPGDIIVVPARIDKGNAMRALKDWSQVISQFGLGAAAITILK